MKSYKIIGLTVALSITGLSLFAQEYKISSPPAPTETNLFNPESGLYRASMGTIRSDIDRFMDVGEFRETSFDKMLTYVGFETQGITIGAGMKLGMFYFGIAYGGSLIQDLFSRATNQDPSELSLELETANGSTTEIPGVYDSNRDKPSEANSRNEFNIFLGLWRFGLKIGFSQTLTVSQPQGEEVSMEAGKSGPRGFAFENALVPSIALGVSIPIKGKVFIVPEISAQLDIHQFVEGADPDYEIINGQNVPFYSVYTQMYNEAKVGADLGLIIRSPKSEMRFGGGYYLKKRVSGFDINSGAEITHIVVDNGTDVKIKSVYENLEQEITPYFLYTGSIGERFKVGIKVLADVRINDYYMTPEGGVQVYGDYETYEQEIYVRPELNFGGTFTILPDRFALHAGFGLNLHTFNIKTAENKSLPDKDESSLVETLPSTRFAVGFTVNLTKTVTIDMLLITSGKFDFKNEPDYDNVSSLRKAIKDNDKFTFFLTMKR
ncbi:MAG: hypothetical protein LBJ86_06765 [Spirochaetaceae bacterium]|nr:hypothetical protein [Spirochaetaceae bacterium]